MFRYLSLFLLIILHHSGNGQRLITGEEAVSLALNNQRNLKAANLGLQQQQQLLGSVADFQSPEIFGESSPYEPLILGVQQTFSFPGVYSNRKKLQNERIHLARLQLQGSQYDLKLDVRLNYLQLQYLTARERILQYQDSIFQAVKISSKRFFDAGQINKLEELQATTQADQIRNELFRVQADLNAEMQIFRFYINVNDSFVVEGIQDYFFIPNSDSSILNIQQQILQQQIVIGEKQLKTEKSELLPQFQAGVLFPTEKDYEKPIGYQFGITIPIWRKQNRNRIAAARTGIEIAKAEQELSQQRLNAQYRQAFYNYQKELQSLNYFNSTALPQARAIIETSQRLFQGGQLNYVESLRNLQTAFDIFFDHVNTHRAYIESVIQLNYLNGKL